MKKIILACLMFFPFRDLRAQSSGLFGAGVALGDPTGLTIKYWLDGSRAFDVGVGFSGDAAFYADFLWHAWDLFPQPSQGRLGGYLATGPQINTDRRSTFGIRTLAGLNYWLAQRPIEIFLEAGPVFELTPERDVETVGGLGVRFYFGGKGG